MKLAEALNLRADLAKRISQLSVRLQNNALVQEGEKPAENPNELIAELNGLVAQQEDGQQHRKDAIHQKPSGTVNTAARRGKNHNIYHTGKQHGHS